MIPLSTLNRDSLIAPQDTEEQIKAKFGLTPNDHEFLQGLNQTIWSIEEIAAQAGAFSKRWISSPEKWMRLLQIVRLSAYCPTYQKAASNAISILNRAGFSFSHLKLKNIKIPEAKLRYGVFEHADLTNVSTKGIDFTRACLTNAQIETLSTTLTLTHKGGVVSIVATPDQARLVSCDRRHLYVWDSITGRLMREGKFPDDYRGVPSYQPPLSRDKEGMAIFPNNDRAPYQLSVSRDGKQVFVCLRNKDLEVWDLETLSLLHSLKAEDRHPHLPPGFKSLIGFLSTPNEPYLVAFKQSDSLSTEITIWDGSRLSDPPHIIDLPNIQMKFPCFSPQTPSIFVCCHGVNVSLFQFPSFEKIKTLDIEGVTSLCFGPEGKTLFLGCKGEVLQVDWNSGEQIVFAQIDSISTIQNLQLISGSSLLHYSLEHQKICFQDIETKRIVGAISNMGPSSFVLNDRLVQMAGDGLVLSRIDDVAADAEPVEPVQIAALTFSSDRQFVRLLRREGIVEEYRARSGHLLKSTSLKVLGLPEDFSFSPYRTYAFLPDGESLMLEESKRRPLNQDDPPQRICTLSIKRGHVWTKTAGYDVLAASQEGAHIAKLCDGVLEIWESTGAQAEATLSFDSILKLSPKHPSSYRYGLTLSQNIFPQGYLALYLVTPIENLMSDAMKSGIHVFHINLETKAIKEVKFFEDIQIQVKFGREHDLWTLDNDQVLKKWNLQTGNVSLEIPLGEDTAHNFHVSHQRKNILTQTIIEGETEVCLWNGDTGACLWQFMLPESRALLSPAEDMLISWDLSEIRAWEINENTLRLLWRKPEKCEEMEPPPPLDLYI